MSSGSAKLQVLMEQWLSCAGHWTESSLYQQMKMSNRFRKRGARRWLTVHELSLKYGSMEVATKIATHKRNDPDCKDQWRYHKDGPKDEDPSLIILHKFPQNIWITFYVCMHHVQINYKLNPYAQDLIQYLVWDVDAEEDEEDFVMNQFFESGERDKSEEKKKTKKNKDKKKGKKRKQSSSSSSSSEVVSDEDSSSSEPWRDCKNLQTVLVRLNSVNIFFSSSTFEIWFTAGSKF